jgi:hypothetical protein
MTRRGYSHGRHYQGAFTQEQADAIVADFTLPEGWRIIPAIIRSFESRSEWGVALWEGNVLEKAVRVYDVRGACFHLQAHAERVARVGTVLTTDRDGYVVAIEDAP